MKTAATILPPSSPAPFPAPVAIPPGAGYRFDLSGLGINWKVDGPSLFRRSSSDGAPSPSSIASPPPSRR
jgi:hypothetical protein